MAGHRQVKSEAEGLYNPPMPNITSIIATLKRERARIDAAIDALISLNPQPLPPSPAPAKPSKATSFNPEEFAKPKKRVVSKAARARMAAAQRARREREKKGGS